MVYIILIAVVLAFGLGVLLWSRSRRSSNQPVVPVEPSTSRPSVVVAPPTTDVVPPESTGPPADDTEIGRAHV